MKRIVLAITGASGCIYGIRLLKELLSMPIHVYLMISPTGRKILEIEAGFGGEHVELFLKHQGIVSHPDACLNLYRYDDFFAPPASGSFRHDGMVIAPCSMKTLASVACGIADTLIHRAADVSLKENRPLILLIRETPLNRIHLKNMLDAAEAGATIMPACPGFYFHPKTIEDLIDSVVARIMDHLNLTHPLMREWGLEIVP